MATLANGNVISISTTETWNPGPAPRPPIRQIRFTPTHDDVAVVIRAGTTAGSGNILYTRTANTAEFTAGTNYKDDVCIEVPASGLNCTVTGTETTTRVYLYLQSGNE